MRRSSPYHQEMRGGAWLGVNAGGRQQHAGRVLRFSSKGEGRVCPAAWLRMPMHDVDQERHDDETKGRAASSHSALTDGEALDFPLCWCLLSSSCRLCLCVHTSSSATMYAGRTAICQCSAMSYESLINENLSIAPLLRSTLRSESRLSTSRRCAHRHRLAPVLADASPKIEAALKCWHRSASRSSA